MLRPIPRPVRTVRSAAALVVALLVVTGCAGGGDADSPSTTAGGAATTEVESPATTAADTASPPTTAQDLPAGLVLRPDGLGSADFGDPAESTIPVGTGVLGSPTHDSLNEECGAGPLRQVAWPGLTLWFGADDDLFVGYIWSSDTVDASTEAGIGVGSTVGELRAAYAGVSVSADTLGPEWFLDTGAAFIGGFLTGTSPNDTVTDVYAGVTCFFR